MAKTFQMNPVGEAFRAAEAQSGPRNGDLDTTFASPRPSHRSGKRTVTQRRKDDPSFDAALNAVDAQLGELKKALDRRDNSEQIESHLAAALATATEGPFTSKSYDRLMLGLIDILGAAHYKKTENRAQARRSETSSSVKDFTDPEHKRVDPNPSLTPIVDFLIEQTFKSSKPNDK